MQTLRKLGFLACFTLPLVTLLGWWLGGYWNFLNVAYVFVGIPVIDYLSGLDVRNVPEERETDTVSSGYFQFLMYAWVVLQLFVFMPWAVWAVATDTVSGFALVGFTLSVGLCTGGIGITVAHELGHQKSPLERFCALSLLTSVCYNHFYIEHNRGHHVHVGTPQDPATGRRGEHFYRFWWRAITQSYLHAWQLERQRLSRRKLSFWTLHNQMLRFSFFTLLVIAFVVGLGAWFSGTFSLGVLAFWLFQGLTAITLLETVDYVEHYGLRRREISLGRYEHVQHMHSWNAAHRYSNFVLFMLQRHADHHANASRRYPILRHFADSPQLPFGYPTMILMALVPPLWFAQMNPRLEDWESRWGMVAQ